MKGRSQQEISHLNRSSQCAHHSKFILSTLISDINHISYNIGLRSCHNVTLSHFYSLLFFDQIHSLIVRACVSGRFEAAVVQVALICIFIIRKIPQGASVKWLFQI